jgi:hypothetical protein
VRREWPVYLVVSLLLALLAGWIAVSRYPDSPAVAAAESWPVVGRWVGELRRLYLPPAAASGDAGAPAGDQPAAGGSEAAGAPAGAARQVRRADGSRAAPALPPPSFSPEDRSLWLAPGDPLRARPDDGAEVVAEADAFTSVAVLERSGGWLRVRLGGRDGWVLPPERAPGEPPLGRAPTPPRPLPPPAPDPARLAAARALLSDTAASRLGPHAVYSDADPALLAFLARVAGAVEPAYVERYRRQPVGTPAGAVVLFAREADYRAFQGGEERLTTLPAGGHASGGLVALWAGERRRGEVAETLVHELTHLLNLRALGPALPPWLDEGLANDLAWGAIGDDGTIDPERIGGAVERDGLALTYHGPRAALRTLAETRAARGLPRLSALAALDWEAFVRSPRRDLHYALAGFLVRYLLAGEDGTLAPPFHGYLTAVAAGGPATGEALLRHLERSWDSLQWGFERWLIAEAAAEAGYRAGVPEAAGAGAVRGSSSRHASEPSA